MSEAIFERDSGARQWIGRVGYAPVRYPVGLAALVGLYYAGAKTGYLLEFAGRSCTSAASATGPAS